MSTLIPSIPPEKLIHTFEIYYTLSPIPWGEQVNWNKELQRAKDGHTYSRYDEPYSSYPVPDNAEVIISARSPDYYNRHTYKLVFKWNYTSEEEGAARNAWNRDYGANQRRAATRAANRAKKKKVEAAYLAKRLAKMAKSDPTIAEVIQKEISTS